MSKKKKSMVQRVIEAADVQATDRLAENMRKLLLREPATTAELAARFNVTQRRVKETLKEFAAAGARLVKRADRWFIDRYLAPSTGEAWKVTSDKDGVHRFGLIADTHLGSKHERLDVMHALYDWFAANGITNVFHCGNWIDGEARFNKHELQPEAHGMQQQLDYFVEHYPQRKGIKTLFVVGDDHEGWYAQREGVDIGNMLVDTGKRAGRDDLVNLGYKEAFVTLEHAKSKAKARMLVDHPGGGSSYALSYAPQKRIESAQGGEKPAIWCFGHWHKSGYFYVRNVHAILVPCCKDLDTFGRKKGLEYHIGGVIVSAQQRADGSIPIVVPRFQMFYDRGYHNQQFSMHGPSEKRL